MGSPENGPPLTGFPVNQTFSFSRRPATGACNTNIHLRPDGEDRGHPPSSEQILIMYNRVKSSSTWLSKKGELS